MRTPPIEVKEFFAQRRTIQAFYEQYGGLTIYRSVNIKNDDELLFLVSPMKGLRPLLKKRVSCKSPYLARILEIGTVPETSHPYWVCALDLGSKFEELLNEYKSARLCRLLRHVAIGLSILHNNNVYHGDVRSSNVWVRHKKIGEEAFLVGVSIDQWAKMIGPPSPKIEQARYMAPEKTMGESSSKKTDIYAFGVMVYRALSGSYPFDGTESFSISASHATEPVPNPMVPFDDPMWDMITKCLSKNPKDRPDSLLSFIELLGVYEQGSRSVHQEPLKELSSEEATPAFFTSQNQMPSSSEEEPVVEQPISESVSLEQPSTTPEPAFPQLQNMDALVEEELVDFQFSDNQHSFSEGAHVVYEADSELTIPPVIPGPPTMDRTDWSILQKEKTGEILNEPPLRQEEPPVFQEPQAEEPQTKNPQIEKPITDEEQYRPVVVEEQIYVPESDLQAISPDDESEHTQTETLHLVEDLDSETMYTVEQSDYSGTEPETMEHTESEDRTVVPARIRIENAGDQEDALAVPKLSISVVSPEEGPTSPPRVALDDISPMAKADITENEDDIEEPEFTGSIDVDTKKYILIFLACFTLTILVMYLIS
ncbi:MAG: hypothetical protein CL916_02175 [Deltaproteobacteria bacterium]|nr:hypothetical protein [Deltaproteobacteria bacterium]